MYFVYYWNGSAEDFEVVGAFSKVDEANRFLVDTAVKHPRDSGPRPCGSNGCWATSFGAVLEEPFAQMLDKATNARLGPLAKALWRLIDVKVEAVANTHDIDVTAKCSANTTGVRELFGNYGGFAIAVARMGPPEATPGEEIARALV